MQSNEDTYAYFIFLKINNRNTISFTTLIVLEEDLSFVSQFQNNFNKNCYS